MEIKQSSDKPLAFAIVGRLDTTTAPTLEDYIANLPNDVWENMTVDMSECDFVSSAGLRVIVMMQKHSSSVGGQLTFSGTKEEVMDVFQMTGFTQLLTFV